MDKKPEDAGRKELLKTAFLKINELKSQLESATTQNSEPIAIVGMGCRFPNGANDPEAFWKLLRDGVDCLVEIPKDRWDIDDFYDPDPEAFGKMYVRRLGLIDNVRNFDPQFFRVSHLEAAGMDPQQRILLEVAWEALENGGLATEQLAGSNTGVFLGATTMDYMLLSLIASNEEDSNEIRVHSATGVSLSIMAGRISHFLGLRGPCMTLDTACSSSVLAIHLACQSLRRGECTMALAGAVNLILAPVVTIATCKGRLLSPDGKCKVFDDSADGYARAEGCGVIVLKTLKDARANGDRILGIIRGTACNQDGKSAGLTAPNGNAQREVIQTALSAAGLEPNDISYVETHGTGTRLGDPIEVQALGEVFAPGRPGDRPLILGAVKSNVGHMEPAAGMAGVIKLLMAFEHSEIPPQLHLQEPNHHIPWDTLPFTLPRSAMPWPAHEGRRFAGLSCFGYSGTNTHMVMEQPPAVVPASNPNDRPWHVLTLSALQQEPLANLAQKYQKLLAGDPASSLPDICFTANTGRMQFPNRLAVVASSNADLEKQLATFQATGAGSEMVFHGAAGSSAELAFMFAEEQLRPEVGRRLYDEVPSARKALDLCDAYSQRLLGRSLLGLLYPNPAEAAQAEKMLRQPTYAQPALFAIGYAFAEMWMSWGLRPTVLLGHGVGELVAGCLADVFDVQDGVRLAVERGRWLGAGLDRTARTVAPAHKDAFSRPLSSARIPIVATSIGRRINDEEARNPGTWQPSTNRYWEQSIAALGSGFPILEIGHASAEVPALAHGDAGRKTVRLAMFAAGEDEWRGVARTAAALYCAGVAVDWAAFDRPYQRRKVALPTYPFQRRECWVAADGSNFSILPGTPKNVIHPLLGQRLPSPHTRNPVVLEMHLDSRRIAFLRDHRYYSTIVVPSGALLEMALAGAEVAFGLGRHSVADLVFTEPLTLPDRMVRLAQSTLTPVGLDEYTIDIWSAELNQKGQVVEGTWRRHATGRLLRGKIPTVPTVLDASIREARQARCTQEIDPSRFYQKLAESRIEFGPTFQVVKSAMRGTDESQAFLQISAEIESEKDFEKYLLHPSMLEAALQLAGLVLRDIESMSPEADLYVPVKIDHVVVRPRPGGKLHAHASIRPGSVDEGERTADVQLFDDGGTVVAEFRGIHLKCRSAGQIQRQLSSSAVRKWIFESGWEEQTRPEMPAKKRNQWLIWAEGQSWGKSLSAELQGRGDRCTLVREGGKFEALPDGSYTCRSAAPEDFDRLIASVAAGNTLPNVVFLAISDSSTTIPPRQIPAQATRQCVGVLHLLQALARAEKDIETFALVTRGAQPASPSRRNDGTEVTAPTKWAEHLTDFSAAALWGIGRVLRACKKIT